MATKSKHPAPTGEKKRVSQARLVASNRQASFRYHLEEHLEAGLVLKGSEVKAIRDGRVTLTEGYVSFHGGEAWLEKVHISHYAKSAGWLPEPVRPRRLLLHKSQIGKWEGRVAQKGLTVVPTKIYLNDAGRVKVEIALARGKDAPDKRETIKKRIHDREARAAMKERSRK